MMQKRNCFFLCRLRRIISRGVKKGFLLSIFCMASPAVALAGPIEDLKPGEWLEIPGSQLNSAGVFPSPIPPGYTGPEAVMSAWNGAAYDTRRDRLLVWGGGHGDYGGNEIYAFDINSFSWSRIWGPSSSIPPVGGTCSETYSDANPASRHTYDGLVYLPSLDKFWSAGGSLYCGSGGGSSGTWMFNLAASTWERKNDAPDNPVTVATAYDPLSGRIFRVGDKYFLTEYDPNAGSWKVRKDIGGTAFGEDTAAVMDPANRLFIYLGNGSLSVFNLDTGSLTSPATSGGAAVVGMRGPAVAYDSLNKKIVGWAGGTSVYSLNPGNWTWTEHRAASTNTRTPPSPTRVGVFGRFQYVPSKNVFILVTSIYENVWIYKLSSGGTVDSPPSAPANLRMMTQ